MINKKLFSSEIYSKENMLYEGLALFVVAIVLLMSYKTHMALVTFYSGNHDEKSRSSSRSDRFVSDNKISDNDIIPSEIKPDETNTIPNFVDDRSEHNTSFPLGDSFPGGSCQVALPTCQRRPSGCMLGCSPCSPLCSGEGNPCMITAPVPSGIWQPQSASTVQYRLRTGNYVPAYCPQGAFALQKAPECSNLGDIHGDKSPKQVTCFTANHL